MMRDTVTQAMIDRLDEAVKDYYMRNAIYKSAMSKKAHTRAAYEQEVRRVCTHCTECRCRLDGFGDDDPLPVCERFEEHFRLITQLAAAIGIRVDPAADGETDSFFEFLR